MYTRNIWNQGRVACQILVFQFDICIPPWIRLKKYGYALGYIDICKYFDMCVIENRRHNLFPTLYQHIGMKIASESGLYSLT